MDKKGMLPHWEEEAKKMREAFDNAVNKENPTFLKNEISYWTHKYIQSQYDMLEQGQEHNKKLLNLHDAYALQMEAVQDKHAEEIDKRYQEMHEVFVEQSKKIRQLEEEIDRLKGSNESKDW